MNPRHLLAVGLFLGVCARAAEPPGAAAGADPYQAAVALQAEGRHKEALEKFAAVLHRDPSDWHARSKIIQSCQALGWLKDRDAHRAALWALRQEGRSPTLTRQDQYCRDQFMVGTNQVMTLEYFEPVPERPVIYAFMVLDAAGKEPQYRLTLGLEDVPRAAPPDPKHPQEPRKIVDRRYRLEGHWPGGVRRIYGFFPQAPDYDAVRALAVEIIEGRRQALPDEAAAAAPPAEAPPRKPGTIGPRTPRRRD